MAQLAILAIALTVLFLLLIQKISIRLILSGGYVITIDYSFISLAFKSDKRRTKKRKNKPPIPRLKAISHSALTILGKSKITVNQLKMPNVGDYLIDSVSSPALDVILETKLYNVLFSGIILLYEELKRRIKKNVRK